MQGAIPERLSLRADEGAIPELLNLAWAAHEVDADAAVQARFLQFSPCITPCYAYLRLSHQSYQSIIGWVA